MLNVIKNNYFLIFSSASVLFHGLIAILLIILNTLLLDSSSLKNSPTPFDIKKISKKNLEKIRKAGQKNGISSRQSPTFSRPTSQITDNNIKKRNTKKTLSLKDLATPQESTKNIHKSKESTNATISKKDLLQPSPQSQILNQKMHQEIQKNNQNTINSVPGYFGKDVYSHIVPPKGISPDEFNSLEKTFYGFRRREINLFYSTFYQKVNDSIVQHPQLKKALRQKDRTTLRIIRDSDGNLISIKVMKSAVDDDIHELILNVFKAIPKIQNIPKQLLDDGKYQVYWDIRLNPEL